MVSSRYPNNWASHTIGTTCTLHRRKLSHESFSEIHWPRLKELDMAWELVMALVVLGSDYHVKIDRNRVPLWAPGFALYSLTLQVVTIY
jgi:hypothetical protein